MPPLEILYEDNHLLAVNKPAGLATMGGTGQQDSLFERARRYIKQRYQKPGRVYLGIVSRLDAAVSGVVLFARTSKAAARLADQFRQRRVAKTYWAIVEGDVRGQAATCVDWLVKDDRRRRMRAVDAKHPKARKARLVYRPLRKTTLGTLVEIQPVTGRKHQIRVQLAQRGHPIVGDRKYGSRTPFAEGIALHARRLVVTHPTRKAKIELVAPVPRHWKQLGLELS
jgi:23S rRNA pseudouridine1911/1915/1917 synthase